MKILVTGFKAFLGASSNPSENLSRDLANIFPEVDSCILSVEFVRSFKELETQLQKQNYELLIMLGQAAGRTRVGFEKVALNWVQSEHSDEAGHKPETGKIVSSEELAIMSKFPIDDIVTKLKTENRQVEISFSAGTFVCNELYYRTLVGFPELKSVFIHVPLVVDLEYGTQLEILSAALKHIIMETAL